MTEGTPASFAEHGDVTARWRPFRDTAEQDRARTYLADASALLRSLIPDIDDRMANDPNLAVTARARVAWAAIRVLDNPRGAKQMQETIGSRSLGITLPDGSASGVFLTEEDLKALQPTAATAGSTAIGTTFLSYRPGWGPPADPPGIMWIPSG